MTHSWFFYFSSALVGQLLAVLVLGLLWWLFCGRSRR